ncbi:SNF2 family N-terminal domain-containing protein [Pisolithus marmoratus]|nr:SNF2 family N-terminal domain-containing protein [Pisolithus marmoratus]
MNTEQTIHLASDTDDEEVFSLPQTPSRLQSTVHAHSTCYADAVTRLLDTDDGGSLTEDAQGVVLNGLRQTVVLWDHQKVGLAWILGKTILGIMRILDGRTMSIDRAHGWARVTLVVCPVSLIGQWENEVEKFAIGLNVVKHHGPLRSNDPLALQDVHVVITSYATVASEYTTICTNSGSHKSALFGVKWWRIILDEAHLIRNWEAKSAEACFNIVGKYRWCFMGTPIQNGVEDLYSMFRFIKVKPLGNLQAFKNYIIKPTKGRQATLAIEHLQVVLCAIMLRHQKGTDQNDALQLPGCHVHVVQCQFNEGAPQIQGRGLGKAGLSEDSFHLCFGDASSPLSSGIVNEDTSSSSSSDSLDGLSWYIEELNAELDDLLARLHLEADDEYNKMICNVPSPSAKMRQLVELLLKIDADSAGQGKMIIFSYFTSMLDLVQPFLSAKGFILARYDGSMSTSECEQNLEYITHGKFQYCDMGRR